MPFSIVLGYKNIAAGGVAQSCSGERGVAFELAGNVTIAVRIDSDAIRVSVFSPGLPDPNEVAVAIIFRDEDIQPTKTGQPRIVEICDPTEVTCDINVASRVQSNGFRIGNSIAAGLSG